MTIGVLAFSNLIAPAVTGLFFCLCFMYFVIVGGSRGPAFRYYLIFLISFGLFSFGRPLQLLLGPYPSPLIIVNVRVFVLCAVVAPSIILAADVFYRQEKAHRTMFIVLPCVLLGIVYDVFNTLGTHASTVVFRVGGIVAYDNLTPARTPPFFGREVTIGVQLTAAIVLLLFSFIALVRHGLYAGFKNRLRDKTFLTNAGIAVFATALIVGSVAQQWWIYYAASIISALLIGAGVLMDAQEVHRHYEKLIPFIKADIAHNVAFSEFSRAKLVELLNCLGKNDDLDRFVIVKLKGLHTDPMGDLTVLDAALETAGSSLSRLFGADHFMLLPLSESRIGVVLRSPVENGNGKETRLLELLEELTETLRSRCAVVPAVGVGRRYDGIERLGSSYREALSALEHAERFDEYAIVHVDDLHQGTPDVRTYPAREKERLLSQIRLGDEEGSRSALAEFVAKFRPYIEVRPELLKVRLYELMGSLIDSAVLGGGDERVLDGLTRKYTASIDSLPDGASAERWLAKITDEIARSVVHVRERRTNALIAKAINAINEHYQMPLSYKDVAREIGISPSYFVNLFKKETGTTFVDFLTAARVEAAKRLLLTSSSSITQIAFDVGFNSSNYFSVIFRKLTGTSAKEYREKRLVEPGDTSQSRPARQPTIPPSR